jgi:hypothetical protein
MTAIQVIALIAFIVALAGVLGYVFQPANNIQDDGLPTVPPYTKDELNNIKLAEELYNKDLRPIVAKKAKAKPVSQLEVVDPQFVAKVVETAKVLPPDATINAEAIVEKVKESKPEFPIDKPTKRKRKFYPRKKKQEA